MQPTAFPLVSIVMSTYNGEQYLDAQMQSLLAQTYRPLEIIVNDDGSTDGTWALLEQWQQQHPQLIFPQKNPTNLGYVKSFEAAMRRARGAYLSLCDQDDLWMPEKTSHLVAAIGSYPMAYCNSLLVDAAGVSTGITLAHKKNLATYTDPAVFLTDNCVAGHATLVTRQLFEQSLPFKAPTPHDFLLAYMSTFYGGIVYLPEVLVHYRNHANNVIGAVNLYKKKESYSAKKQRRLREEIVHQQNRLQRLQLFLEKCPDSQPEIKALILRLLEAYQDFSYANNLKRVSIFLEQRKRLLAIKKRPALRKWFFCLKMYNRTK